MRDLGRKVEEVEEAWGFVTRANEPTVLEQGSFERLVGDRARSLYAAPDGELRPYLEPEEVAALQVRRGSLTDVERVEIESHVDHTATFLRDIPWGRRYADVPAHRRRPPRVLERQRLPAPAGFHGHSDRVPHHDHRGHLRRPHGFRPPVQESRPHRPRASASSIPR